VAVVPSAGASSRVVRSAALSARAALGQHVFTDDGVGPAGAHLALGAALTW
jgi:hypothetical protein